MAKMIAFLSTTKVVAVSDQDTVYQYQAWRDLKAGLAPNARMEAEVQRRKIHTLVGKHRIPLLFCIEDNDISEALEEKTRRNRLYLDGYLFQIRKQGEQIKNLDQRIDEYNGLSFWQKLKRGFRV